MPATSETLPVLDRRPSEPRAVVTWAGPGEPIMLALYGPAGEVAVPLLPKRALTLAQELIEPCRGDRNHHSSTRGA